MEVKPPILYLIIVINSMLNLWMVLNSLELCSRAILTSSFTYLKGFNYKFVHSSYPINLYSMNLSYPNLGYMNVSFYNLFFSIAKTRLSLGYINSLELWGKSAFSFLFFLSLKK